MARYTLFLLCFIVTPLHAQIEQCEVVHLTNAIVISEYLPCPRLDSFYVEGNHFIYVYGKAMHFKPYSDYNKYLIDHFETNVYIPECLHTTKEDPILHSLLNDYSYNLLYSVHERINHEIKGRLDSNDFYRQTGKKKLYVAYSFEGEIVMYKMRRKIMLEQGFEDPIFSLRPSKSSKFAVLKKAGRLRSLTMEEANAMNLKKVEKRHIRIFRPE